MLACLAWPTQMSTRWEKTPLWTNYFNSGYVLANLFLLLFYRRSDGQNSVYNGKATTTLSPAGVLAMSDVPIPADIRNLPVPDRIELATKIWESVVEDNAAVGLSEEHKNQKGVGHLFPPISR